MQKKIVLDIFFRYQIKILEFVLISIESFTFFFVNCTVYYQKL